MRRSLALLSFSLLIFFEIVQAQTGQDKHSAALKAPDSGTISTLERNVPELMRKGSVPGLSLALIRNGKTYWVHGFGVRNANTGQPVTDDTVFEAASLSKPVFAYGVLKLVDQDKLDLDTPLTKYLPKSYIEGDHRLDKITTRIVLSHRTGFPNWRGDGNALTIHFTPGERFSYSGEGFVYLQKVVEQLTGKPLNEFVTETVFAPLGMTSSSYVWRADYDERAATGHDSDGQAVEKRKPTEGNAAASLHTTAKDYALFVDAVLNGTGLKPKTLREMERPLIPVDPECTNCTDRAPAQQSKSVFWGLGWGIQETNQGESLWHWGDNGSFKCYVVAFPKQKLGLVMFTDGENGLAIYKDVIREAIGGEQPAFAWLKYDSYDSAAMQFGKAVREKGADAAIREFSSSLKSGAISEGAINSTGYRLLVQKKTAEAIYVFQLNVELYPKSWNTYDSLGEAYMDAGDTALSIQNYEKSLAMNAKNTKAAEMLKKLKTQ